MVVGEEQDNVGPGTYVVEYNNSRVVGPSVLTASPLSGGLLALNRLLRQSHYKY